MSKLFFLFTLIGIIVSSNLCYAKKTKGNENSGGGDPCENRIQVIRDDIRSWISGGGHKGLNLFDRVSHDEYERVMLLYIGEASINCVAEGDEGYPVEINGTPKVCRFDKEEDGTSKVTCDYSKFLLTSETEQYRLIHHEFAGLAGVEKPDGDISDYMVSDQITEYLEDVVVKKLGLKPKGLEKKIAIISCRNINGVCDCNLADGRKLSCSRRSTTNSSEMPLNFENTLAMNYIMLKRNTGTDLDFVRMEFISDSLTEEFSELVLSSTKLITPASPLYIKYDPTSNKITNVMPSPMLSDHSDGVVNF